MTANIFTDMPTRPPRCGCGSQRFQEEREPNWALVRFKDDQEFDITGKLPVRLLVCRDCGTVKLIASFVDPFAL